MDLYQAEEFFKNLYPSKKITMEFDQNCHREINFIFTKGSAHGINHIAFERVKVSVEGMEPQYVPIAPHRICASWNELKKFITTRTDFHVNDSDLHVLSDLQALPSDHKDKWQYETKIKEILNLSELSREVLLVNVLDYETNRKPKSV